MRCPLHGHHERGAGEAAHGRFPGKGAPKDEGDGIGDSAEVHDDEAEADDDVDDGHEGDDFTGDAGNALKAADGDQLEIGRASCRERV